MMWIIESVQSVVLPVDSQRILCQIIRADTEEINMLRQLLTHHDSRRSLDHNSLFRNCVRNLFFLQLLSHLSHDFLNIQHFLHGNDHRIHNSQCSVFCRPEKCSQLRLKDLRLLQTDPDRAVSHGRIIFLAQSEVIYIFVRTDIKGTDDDLFPCHHLQHLTVSIELFCLIRKRIPSEI